MGENNSSEILKAKLIEALHFTLDFCNNHGLKCYGCGGTVLGAVRHKGFIPWDDDIDLYMPRKDYNKLISLNGELQLSGYYFVCLENDKEYYLPFGKIVDKTTTIWEMKRFPYLIGVNIDIFPLDYFSCNDADIEKERHFYDDLYRKYQLTLETYDHHLLWSRFRFSRDIKLVFNTIRYSGNKRKKDDLYDKIIKKIDEYKKQNGEKCVCLTQWLGRIFQSSWFDNSIALPFEDTMIQVPGDYHEYLKLLYGDYMKLPPIEKRHPTHDDVRYYTNLREKVSLVEAQKQIATGNSLIF